MSTIMVIGDVGGCCDALTKAVLPVIDNDDTIVIQIGDLAEPVTLRSTVDWVARHTTTRISGMRFIGADPKHGRSGAASWSPFVLERAALLA